ncbi:DUF6683 family protein [Thiofilum flexile]|uniref:DUF6683 family protein n=1 Tax=Thiofilum flexile TaxID=125627 RepID=UPI00036E88DA|nr:DUF6683 family protein [Thiofilum flexile]
MRSIKIVLPVKLLVTLHLTMVNSYASYKHPIAKTDALHSLRMAAAPTDTQPTPPQPEVDYLSFKADLNLRRQFTQQFIDRIQSQNPLGAEALITLQAQGDIIATIETTLAAKNLTVTHLADAYTVWWVSMWQAAQGKPYELNRETAQAVRQQATQALLKTGVFKTTPDGSKQELAETLLLQALLLDTTLTHVHSNPSLLQQLSESVLNEAQQSGLALDQMTLTPKGFVPTR